MADFEANLIILKNPKTSFLNKTYGQFFHVKSRLQDYIHETSYICPLQASATMDGGRVRRNRKKRTFDIHDKIVYFLTFAQCTELSFIYRKMYTQLIM